MIIEILINTLSKPMQIGFYEDKKLLKVKEYEGLTSDILLPVIKDILNRYKVEAIIYTNGPGSHMATKIAFVLLKTLNILKDIPIYSVSGFELNNNKAIKALGKLYFIKEKENIITKRFDEDIKDSFYMPQDLSKLNISENIEPNYNIAAV